MLQGQMDEKSTFQDAVKILMLCMETAARKTASVSQQFFWFRRCRMLMFWKLWKRTDKV